MSRVVIFGQMTVLFAMMMLGFVVRRKKVINAEVSACLSTLVVNVFNPILIISSVLEVGQSISRDNLLINFGLILLFFLILIGFSFLVPIILRPAKREKPMYVLMTVFSNVGYIGIPVAKGLYGNEATLYVAFYILGFSVCLYSYGVFVAERIDTSSESDKQPKPFFENLKKIMNPGMIACITAVIISGFQITLPEPVVSFCEYIGTATIPLSMIILGASFADEKITDIIKEWRAYAFTVIRMVLLPVLVYYATRFLQLDEIVYGVFILELSMPVAAVVALLIQEKGSDPTCCVRGTIITTLASVVTVPLVWALTMG